MFSVSGDGFNAKVSVQPRVGKGWMRDKEMETKMKQGATDPGIMIYANIEFEDKLVTFCEATLKYSE